MTGTGLREACALFGLLVGLEGRADSSRAPTITTPSSACRTAFRRGQPTSLVSSVSSSDS